MFVKVFGDSSVSRATVFPWQSWFAVGEESIEDLWRTLMTLGRCVLLYFWTQEVTVGIYISHHKIYGIKISPSSNFNLVSIALRYENNIIIFFLSTVLDSNK